MRRVALTLSLVLLAGCGGGFGFGGGAEAPRQAMVTSDAIIVTGPQGFCVDPTATRESDDTAFVLLGNCAAISNSRRADQPTVPALLTAAISARSDAGSLSESLAGLDGFFRSEEGRALLSRSQDATTVTVLDSRAEGEMFLLHARDTSETSIRGVQQDYWRVWLDLGPRIATLSVLALEDRDVSEGQSLDTLRAFAGTVRAANLGQGADGAMVDGIPVTMPEIEPIDAETTGGSGLLWNIGFFRRILG